MGGCLTKDAREIVDVTVGKSREQQAVNGVDMAGEHCREHGAASLGECQDGAAFVIGRGRAGNEPTVFQQLRLVGQSAAAVDHAVGEIRHAQLPIRSIAQASEELELDVAEVAGITELFLNCMAQQATHLGESEVRPQLRGRQGRWRFVHALIIDG
jgi:hypothetical protein